MNKFFSLSDSFIFGTIQRLQLFIPKLSYFNQSLVDKSRHIQKYLINQTGLSTQSYTPLSVVPHTVKTSKPLLDHSQQPLNSEHGQIITNKLDKKEIQRNFVLGEQPSILATPVKHTHPDVARIRRASWAFTTRRVPHEIAFTTVRPEGGPNTGDLVLARVEAIGHHTGLQLANGRRKKMFEGDEIVVAYGNRYASSQFEALLPTTMGPCHLVAGGGVASRAISWHNRITKGPTHIKPIGLLVNAEGKRINLREFAIQPINQISAPLPTTVAVVGTSMDSGKTQTAAYLVKGLIAGGLHVGYAKVTGTGAGGDTWLLKDAGASPVLDFTDAGMATTYMASPAEIESILMTLVGQIIQEGVDAIVLEIADGVFQRETVELLQSPVFSQLVGGIVVAARDSMGASAGVNWLKAQKTQVFALSGVISSAPLQSEEARQVLGLPVYNREELSTSIIAMDLIAQVQQSIKTSRPKENHVQVVH